MKKSLLNESNYSLQSRIGGELYEFIVDYIDDIFYECVKSNDKTLIPYVEKGLNSLDELQNYFLNMTVENSIICKKLANVYGEKFALCMIETYAESFSSDTITYIERCQEYNELYIGLAHKEEEEYL